MGYYVTLEQLKGGVDNADKYIPVNINSQYFLKNGLNLQEMRKNAQHNLEELLKVLGYTINGDNASSALADLNRRIQEFHATTASFNGPLLRQAIMNPLKGVVVNEMQEEMLRFKQMVQGKQEQINQVFIQVVQEVANSIVPENGEITAEAVATELYALLNQMAINFKSGKVELPSGGTRIKSDFKIPLKETIAKKLKSGISSIQFSGDTDPSVKQLIDRDANFTRRLILLASQYQNIDLTAIFPRAERTAPTFEVQETGDGLRIYYDILTPFLDEMEASDNKGTKAEKAARDYFEKMTEPRKSQMIEKLVKRAQDFFNIYFDDAGLTGERRHQLQENFNQAIRDIVSNYPASLFVGSNEQGVIGILGEIQGLYYVYSIMGDLRSDIDPKTLVSWIGGDTTVGGSAKTGADLIVQLGEKLGYGIQVKNSMDLTGATNLSDFILGKNQRESEFYNQLVNFGIDEDVVVAIEDVFNMQSFNIGYHFEGDVAEEGNPRGRFAAQYLTTYDKVEKLVVDAQRFMALAAVRIMRIQYLEDQGFKQNNTLWIVGGTAIISAVQILDDLIREIDGAGGSFKTSASAYLNDKKFTIVDYLNNKVDISGMKSVLKTSYNFHKVG